MTRLTLFLVGWLVPLVASGQTGLAWDASVADATHSAPSGYTLQWGTAPGVYTQTLDVQLATSVPLPAGLTPAVPYFFTVVARGAGGVSAPSSEVRVVLDLPIDHACDYPLGNRAITIFVTPPLLKTGGGGADTEARLSFRVLSPNSPITHIGILSNNMERPGALNGTDLSSTGSLWFLVPASGPTPYAITAKNAYGCTRTQAVQ